MATVGNELRIRPLLMHGEGGASGLVAYRGRVGVGGDHSVVINELSALTTELDGEKKVERREFA